MVRVSEVLRHKPAGVESVRPDDTILHAARAMNARKIGSLVVSEDHDAARLLGIVTERDILTRVVAEGRDPATTRVAHVMTRAVITCTPDTALDELRRLMLERRIRHVPVVEAARTVGMVSIGDLNAAETTTLVQTIRCMEAYIAHGAIAG